jgi:hypothetical protein
VKLAVQSEVLGSTDLVTVYKLAIKNCTVTCILPLFQRNWIVKSRIVEVNLHFPLCIQVAVLSIRGN